MRVLLLNKPEQTERMEATFVEYHSSKDVNTWFLMDSPGVILSIVLSYFIFVMKVGPALMKNRKPFELGRLVVLYNFLQILLSAFLVYKCLKVDSPYYALFGGPCPKSLTNGPDNEVLIHSALWWYSLAKITELLDTVIFVLRKSDRQVTFLHVYHHGGMVLYSWLYVKYGADYRGPYGASMNSIIHVIMYTYYMLAAMGPQYKKYLWWKKYMTVMQLIQFSLMLLSLTIIKIKGCETNAFGTLLCFTNVPLFLWMFLNFYRNSYSSKTVKQQQ